MTDIELLLRDPRVAAARRRLRRSDGETLREQLRIAAIPAPSGEEAARAAFVAERLRACGAEGVEQDAVGNVHARLAGGGAGGEVIVAAHLDSVFPAGTPLRPRVEGTRTYAPGITDNARGLAAMLALARVLADGRISSARAVRLVATVGEEGLGDLRGVKHLFREGSPHRDAAAFVALDGTGCRRIVHRAIGSRRLRLQARGPGGHSWADWGTANPVHAVGAAVGALRALELPPEPRTTLTVARIGGGTSINSVPADAWAELDLRSGGERELEELEARCRELFRREVDAENARRRAGTAALRPEVVVIGSRPAGSLAPEHPLVLLAAGATRAIGGLPELVASSTDANVPLAIGVPAVAIGAGGVSGGIHTTGEWYANQQGAPGIERALLLVLGAAGAGG